MTLYEWFLGGGGILVAALTIIQIVPVKINPWSKIARGLGRALNVEVMEKLSESEASTARYRILRFDDEIRHKTKHTEEHFNQILDDIDAYEQYCNQHPNYKNHKAVSAVKNIRKTYDKCREEGGLLV